MTQAVIFDLDGTLIQTEVLKARSYAEAMAGLTRYTVSETRVMKIFGEFVGRSRQEVVAGLTSRFAAELNRALGTDDPAELQSALNERRLLIYQRILDDGELLAQHYCPYSLRLFRELTHDGYLTVLATMSHREQARRITSAMGIFEQFDLFLAREDVENGKPDPEIYLLAGRRLGVGPQSCLVIEDSVHGIRAAQNAGMPVFAVTNDVTRASVHESRLLPPDFVVDDLPTLSERVFAFLRY